MATTQQQQRSAADATRNIGGSISLAEFWSRIDPAPEGGKRQGQQRAAASAGQAS